MSDKVTGSVSSPENLVGTLSSGGTISGEVSSPSSVQGIVNRTRSVNGLFSATQQQMSGRLNNTIVSAGSTDYNELDNKPSINNVELVGNKTTSELGINIPTATSQLTNDSGFITTETDPTVPAWAKQPTKPSYTANEVGALPSDTFIPTKVSDLTNDAGYITSYTETDPVFTASAAAGITSGDISSWNSKLDTWVHDLGSFDMEDYDWEFEEYLTQNTIVTSGFDKIYEEQDGFYYYIIIERVGDSVYQEWWYTEEGGLTRFMRTGYYDGEAWEYNDTDQNITLNTAYNIFATINHNHDIVEDVNQSNMLTYFNTFGLNKSIGSYKIVNSYDKSVYYLTFDYRYVSGLSGSYRLYQFYTCSRDNQLHMRFGTRNGSSVVWGAWQTYSTYADIESTIAEDYYDKDEINEMLGSVTAVNMIPIVWADLVELRDNDELKPGCFYRITDYNFITSKLGIQSGNHQFDIVVLAISESMLSETAYAVKNANDHYFEREVTTGGIEWLYTIYVDDYAENYGDEPVDHADDIHCNDVFCYADTDIHPDTGEEVPVLFKTDSSEYDFDDPDWDDMFYWCGTYDLDGDEYDMWGKYEDGEFMHQYALTPIVVEDGELVVSPIPETKIVPVNMNAWELKYCLDNDKELFGWADTNGKGVIYYMKDEFGNEAPYDFKNVKYARRYINAVDNSILNNLRYQYAGEDNYYAITTTSSVKYFYTFDDNNGTDASLFGDASYNVIDTWILDGQKQLNNIVAGNASNNHFLSNTHNVTFINSCTNNEFQGDNCLFAGAAYVNGTYRQCTMIGVSGFESAGLRTSIAQQPNSIKVLGSAYDLNLGNNLSSTEISGGCMGITFGNYCRNIKIGTGCNTITFGMYCIGINIGMDCNRITLTNYYRYVDIMDGCSQVTLNTTGGNTTNYVQYVTLRKGVNNISLTPTRKTNYEQIYYKTGKTETAV